jgi:hypothetical protein
MYPTPATDPEAPKTHPNKFLYKKWENIFSELFHNKEDPELGTPQTPRNIDLRSRYKHKSRK